PCGSASMADLVRARAHGLLQRLEISTRFQRLIDARGIEEGPDGIGGEIRGSAHEIAGFRPIAEDVTLQLDEVSFRILVVQRNRRAMIAAECGLYVRFAQPIK